MWRVDAAPKHRPDTKLVLLRRPHVIGCGRSRSRGYSKYGEGCRESCDKGEDGRFWSPWVLESYKLHAY